MNNIFSDEQWNTIQKLDTHYIEHEVYNDAEKFTFCVCGVVILYLICQVLRGAF